MDGAAETSTDPRATDERLVGRTYAIPFDRVWKAARALAEGGLRGWELVRGDDREGVMDARSFTFPRRRVDDVRITVRLDENAQTRVDLRCRRAAARSAPRRHARVIGRFFRSLDRRLNAGPGERLDPTLAPAWLKDERGKQKGRATMLIPALLVLASACGGTDADIAPSGDEGAEATVPEAASQRIYERGFVFVSEIGDSLLMVPWLLRAETGPDSVRREARGWFARGGTWEPFYSERWRTAPTRTPERILPHGDFSLVVRDGDLVDGLIFQDGPRSLEVVMGEVLATWIGPTGETMDVMEGATYLSDERIEGLVMDIARSWALGDPGAGDWAFLISGDSLRMVLAADIEHGLEPEPVYRAWVQRGTEELLWPEVRVSWSDRQGFPPARRDVPTGWTISSDDRTLGGSLESVTSELEAGEGPGPLLPVRALIEVRGVFLADGGRFPVRGIVLHQRR